VPNGRLAVEAVCRNEAHDTYDLVLMDIQMPEMDGYAATGLIREFEKRHGKKAMPIIAMTAHALAEERQRCKAEGMDDHISKPVDPRLLFSTIQRWLAPEKLSATGDERGPKNSTAGIDRRRRGSSGMPIDDLPDALPGVDLSAGLQRMAGNKDLYCEILKKFGRKYRDLPTQISEAIGQKNFRQAAGLTHNLKGIAGNIGAQQAYEVLQQLETALEEDASEDCQKLFRNANEHVASVFAGIDRWLQNLAASRPAADITGEPEPHGTVAMDAAGIRQAFKDLKSYLKAYNMDALEVLTRLERATRGQHREELGEIRELVDELEFDQAMDKVNALSEQWR